MIANLKARRLGSSGYLSWDAYPGATGYDVERDGIIVARNLNATVYQDNSELSHKYRVRSVFGQQAVIEDPPPASWQQAVDDSVLAQTYAAIESWYVANTSFEALGIQEQNLVPGSLESQFDGQVIEGIRGGPIRIAHNNVTVRGCLVEDWGLYGAYFNPTFGANLTGNVVEYCRIAGPGGDPLEQERGCVFAAGVPNSVIVRNCDVYGWTSGMSSMRRMVAEYNWIHDLASGETSGAHRTSLMTDASSVTFRRNYCTDGGSSCISVYCDKNPVFDVLLEGNILNGSSPNASPSWLINTKSGTHGLNAYNVKYLDNLFGDQFQFGMITGGNIPWGTVGNEKAGNKILMTGELIGND